MKTEPILFKVPARIKTRCIRRLREQGFNSMQQLFAWMAEEFAAGRIKAGRPPLVTKPADNSEEQE